MGDYEGVFLRYEMGEVVFKDDHGDEQQDGEMSFRLLNGAVASQVEDLQVGDHIRVEVEFNNYRATSVTVIGQSPRELDARLRLIEARFALTRQQVYDALPEFTKMQCDTVCVALGIKE